MLKIRLRRMGAIRQPHYRIVVADARAPRDGAFFEILGHYNPRTHPATINIDIEKYNNWKVKGAQPTDAVERLVRQYNREARKAAAEGEAAQPTSRRTRTASGKGVSKPAPVAAVEPEAEAEAAVEEPAAMEAAAEVPAEETAAAAPTEEAPAEETAETPVIEEAAADTESAS